MGISRGQKYIGLVLKCLPKNHLSFLVGQLVHMPLPQSVAASAVRWFAKRYNINMDEAEKSMAEYETIGQLFTRNLKPGVRPIQSGVVHPVDGRITSWGEIHSGTLLQVKGKTYQLADFLQSEKKAAQYEGGTFITYYLCPTDYHQIHAPFDADIAESAYIPGRLWPVNEWSVSSVENLFSVNERLITYLNSERGGAALVMVGATNVGKMTVSYDAEIVSNSSLSVTRKPILKVYKPALHINKGEKLGIFHMGSTVVMIYPKGFISLAHRNIAGPVRLGETLAD